MSKLIRGTNKEDMMEYVYRVSKLRRTLMTLVISYICLIAFRGYLTLAYGELFTHSTWSLFLAGMTGILMGVAIHAVVIYKGSLSLGHIDSDRDDNAS